jgi:hypothetical protein
MIFCFYSERQCFNYNWSALETKTCPVEVPSWCVCWREESVLWQSFLEDTALSWWVVKQLVAADTQCVCVCVWRGRSTRWLVSSVIVFHLLHYTYFHTQVFFLFYVCWPHHFLSFTLWFLWLFLATASLPAPCFLFGVQLISCVLSHSFHMPVALCLCIDVFKSILV